MTGSEHGPSQALLLRPSSAQREASLIIRLADELAASGGTRALLRLAVGHAVGALELQRAKLFVRERYGGPVVLDGSFAASGPEGCVVRLTERVELCPAQVSHHLELSLRGPGFERVDGGQPRWTVATPLVARGNVVGLLINEAGEAGEPLDEARQRMAVASCGVLSILYDTRRETGAGAQGSPRRQHLVEKVLEQLTQRPDATGQQLADAVGVSPGHLARTFRRATGMSLVEYRNRLRMHRFFELVDPARASTTLHGAALASGFGCYSQFQRVFRDLLGTSPSVALAGGRHALRLPELPQPTTDTNPNA
jgi:AraC-like DNA-binding protein